MSKRDDAKAKLTKAKLDLLDLACENPLVSDAEFRHQFVLLSKFWSSDSGQCNPSDAKLGEAAGGKCERTAWEATNGLQEKGYLAKIRTRGASMYVFPGLPLPQKLAGDDRVTSATSCENFRKIVSELPQPACGTEPLPEPCPEPIGADAPSSGQSRGEKGNGAEPPVSYRKGRWYIRQGCAEFHAWRVHAEKIADWDLYWRFPDKAGHVAEAPSRWPKK